jgi:hypothetical protein
VPKPPAAVKVEVADGELELENPIESQFNVTGDIVTESSKRPSGVPLVSLM